jgi:hypothetical protein
MNDEIQSESQHHIYYRTGSRDHITKDGKPVCNGRVRTPAEDDLKPIEELTDREFLLLTSDTSNLCSRCMGYASRIGLFESAPDGDLPEFPCPECGEPAQSVGRVMGIAQVEHGDGTTHEIDFAVYERWRQGEDMTH